MIPVHAIKGCTELRAVPETGAPRTEVGGGIPMGARVGTGQSAHSNELLCHPATLHTCHGPVSHVMACPCASSGCSHHSTPPHYKAVTPSLVFVITHASLRSAASRRIGKSTNSTKRDTKTRGRKTEPSSGRTWHTGHMAGERGRSFFLQKEAVECNGRADEEDEEKEAAPSRSG